MKILVVDDDRGILDLLSEALRGKYEVRAVTSGEEALLHIVQEASPDLAIIDVCLPGMDGLELTRRLRTLFGETYLPVVAITGSEDQTTRARAYEAGCDDVLPKPFQIAEVRARVESLLRHRREHKLKEDLAALVVHDLRNPLSALRMNLELLNDELKEGTMLVRETLADCAALIQRALTLVGGLLDVAELEGGLLHVTPSEVSLAMFLPRLWTAHQPDLRLRNLTVELEVTPKRLVARFDPDLVGRVVENLLDNAVRYAKPGGKVRVTAARDDAGLTITVGNDGPPIREADRERVFDKFFRIEERRAGARANRGLGLYFCKLVAEAHGGSIEVVERPEWPCVFRLTLPQV